MLKGLSTPSCALETRGAATRAIVAIARNSERFKASPCSRERPNVSRSFDWQSAGSGYARSLLPVGPFRPGKRRMDSPRRQDDEPVARAVTIVREAAELPMERRGVFVISLQIERLESDRGRTARFFD